MKKSIFLVAATFGLMIGTSAFAQQNAQQRGRKVMERPSAEQLAQQKTDRMKAKLSLNEEQAQQIYAYNLQQVQAWEAKQAQLRAEREAKRAEMEAARKARFEKMQAARKAEADKMKSILTPEQFEKWQQLQRRAHGKYDKRGKAGKGPRRDRMHRGGKPGQHAPQHFDGKRGPGAKRGERGGEGFRPEPRNDRPEQQ